MLQGSRYRYHFILGLIVLVNSGLLLFKIFLEMFVWQLSFSSLFWDSLALLWPLLGIWCAVEFFRKDIWGWGGILFHFFILYCAIYYAIQTIIFLINFNLNIQSVLLIMLNFIIALLGWVGFFLYYD
jgi:hypothetical protein